MSEVRELWEIQREFTEKFWGTKGGMPDPRDEKAMTTITKDYALHIIAEVTEVVQELSWRMHRAVKGEVDRDNVLEELIDVNKFLLGLIQVWGYSFEQYENEFKRKSMVVEQRFAQEQTFPSLMNHPMALIDIDGVLADYPRGFYHWVYLNCPEAGMFSVHSAEKWYRGLPLKDREQIKKKYRQSGAKATLPVLPGAAKFVHLVRERGLKAVLITNRPYADYYRIYPDTLEWLVKNEIPYDGIVWARDKGLEAVKQFKNVCWAVDDDSENIKRFREAKIPTIQVDPGDENNDTSALLTVARRVAKIEDLAYEWKKELVS